MRPVAHGKKLTWIIGGIANGEENKTIYGPFMILSANRHYFLQEQKQIDLFNG
jgi:hypothetical protein